MLKSVFKLLNCVNLNEPGGRQVEIHVTDVKLLILETPGGRQEESYPRPHLLDRK